MSSIEGAISNRAKIIWFSILLIVFFFIGLGIIIVAAVLPTYLTTDTAAPYGERYCIDDLRLTIAFNSSTYYGFLSDQISESYPLSLACTRVLRNYYSDSQLSSCLVAGCSLANRTVPSANIIRRDNVVCRSVVVYYSVRCTDQPVLSGLYNYLTSSGNGNCRKNRMTRINEALGSTRTVDYTNVPTLTISNTAVAIVSVSSRIFANSSRSGAQYCGSISRASIASAVNAQANG